MLSVIIPAFNEEAMIRIAAKKIKDILESNGIENELIFVDDGSADGTWKEIEHTSKQFSHIRGLHLSRNFGKESAIFAGLNYAKGDCCAVIDCDLQHPPEKLVEMYHMWEKGYEVVEGVKSSRGDESKAHALAAKWFYSLISKATGFDMENASDFKLLDKKAVNVIINMPEKNAFFRAMSSWVGFKTTSVVFDVQERETGESKWSTTSLIKYAFNNIASFSTAPMQIVTILGIIALVATAVFGGVSLIQKLSGRALEGFTTVILLQLFSSSIIMISLGIIGYYISKIYSEVKNRPRYIVSECCGGECYEKIS